MQNFIVPDFETKSFCDLKKCGAWVYASDYTTEVQCCGFEYAGANRPLLWRPDEPCPDIVYKAIELGWWFVAHNVNFERQIWARIMVPFHGWPEVPDHLWFDTQASCAHHALPLALEKAPVALGMPYQKLKSNKQWFTPDKKTGQYADPMAGTPNLYEYCLGDLAAQKGLLGRLGVLPGPELAVWRLDQTINNRGVGLDLPFVNAALAVCDAAALPLLSEFRGLAGGLNPTQRDKVLSWVRAQGVEIPDLKKETITKLIGAAELEDEEDDEDAEMEDNAVGDEDTGEDEEGPAEGEIPASVRRALEVRRILSSASIKKLGRMLACVDGDGRARGLLQYHGASTGRWSGRLLQPQNFPRGTLKVDGKAPNPEALVEAILSRDYEWVEQLYGCDAISAVSSGLRHAIIAGPGRSLLVGDFAKIECVIVLAFAGAVETARNVIKNGSAVYTDMSTGLFGRPITKHDVAEYTIGKNVILGCGFQMGWKKFYTRYCQPFGLPSEFAKKGVTAYREDFAPEVPKFWRGIEEAALRCVWDRVPVDFGPFRYELEDGFLSCRLPSGRKLWYYDPKPTRKEMPWSIEKHQEWVAGGRIGPEPRRDARPSWRYLTWKGGKMRHTDAYGGLLTENVVQATARDLLCSAMFRCEKENLPVILTVHDELCLEVEPNRADPEHLRQIMTFTPKWAEPLKIPMEAECWTGPRYRK